MKSLIGSALIAASLALSGNAATAANAVHNNTKANVAHVAAHVARPRAAVHLAAGSRYPRGNVGFDMGQFFQSLFGGGPARYVPTVRAAGRSRGAGDDSGSWDYSPSYDSATVDTSSNDQAQQASEQANEISLMNSMQAAQQQNDEANAETNAGIAAGIQTEINANN